MILPGPRINGYQQLVPGKLYEHLDTGGCVVCAETKGSLHKHHILPMSAGGRKSPLVLLCNSCHEGLHDCQSKEMPPGAYSNLDNAKQRWQSKYELVWVDFLLKILHTATRAARGDPNSTVSMKLYLDAHENDIVEHVQRILKTDKVYAVRHLIATYPINQLYEEKNNGQRKSG